MVTHQMGRKTMMAVSRMSCVDDSPSALAKISAMGDKFGDIPKLQVGDRVLVGSTQLPGVVKFIGSTEFSAGEWVGVSLDDPCGKNDGCVKGTRYFTCDSNYGLFVRPTAVVSDKKEAEEEEEPSYAPRTSAQVQLGAKTSALQSPTLQSTKTQKSPSPAHASAKTVTSYPPNQSAFNFMQPPSQPSPASQAVLPPRLPVAAKGSPWIQSSPPPQSPSDLKQQGLAAPIEEVKLPATTTEPAVDVERVSRAQRDLAEAMEDHDVDRLRRALPTAASLGVQRTELDAAMRVLNYEVQRSLFQEVEDARSVVTQLIESVAFAEARAKEAEEAAAATTHVGSAPSAPVQAAKFLTAVADGAEPSQAWIEQVGAKLEERVWSGLQLRIEKAVRVAISQATQALLDAVQEFREASSDVTPKDKKKVKVRMELDEGGAATRIQARHRGNRARRRPKTMECSPTETQSDARFIVRWWLQSATENFRSRTDLIDARRAQVEALRRDLCSSGDADVVEQSKKDAELLKLAASRSRENQVSVRQVAKARQAALPLGPEKSVTKLQRAARAWFARRRCTNAQARDLHRSVQSIVSRRKAWGEVFDSNLENGIPGLFAPGFSRAIQQIHPRITNAQAFALWKGYLSGAGVIAVDFGGFHAMAEAIAIGDHCAVEFAAMTVEAFRLLGVTEADKHATRLQAAHRGHAHRKRHRKLRKRDWKRAEEELATVQQERAAIRIQAIHRGKNVRAKRWEIVQENSEMRQKKRHKELTEAAVILQKNVRRLHARRKYGKMSFSSAVTAVRRRHAAWTSIFDEVANGAEHLSKDSFRRAFQEVIPRASDAQAEAVWDGYVLGTDLPGVDLRGLAEMLEAAVTGDEVVCEYADMCVEDYEALADDPQSCNDDGCRGNLSESEWRKSRPDFCRHWDDAWAREPTSDHETFERAMCSAHPQLTRAQVTAIRVGLLSGTESNMLCLSDFSAAAEAVEIGDREAAEFADVSVEIFTMLGAEGGSAAATKLQARHRGRQERQRFSILKRSGGRVAYGQDHDRSAIRIQSLVRTWAARRTLNQKMGGADFFHRAAIIARSKHKGIVAVFDAAAIDQGGSLNCLRIDAFERALIKVHPRLSRAQVHALYNGAIEGLKRQDIDIKSFCSIVEAVGQGDDAASEFADMPTEEFTLLARDGAALTSPL
eukprot:TRINITY_DN41436_c0_g1_i1.p1 TRINITY_DN41436_c0_g1~~TRINITY_DN41436_c0_g1_i1.p1  ORF type:complete len:1177 (-),score=202.14 TRINITY_DN41436_c0_g1_i1:40-3570(-)